MRGYAQVRLDVYIYIYRERGRQKCQFAALHCIFCCSTNFLLQSSVLLQIWFKELLYQENGCVPITYGTFQDQQGLSYPHKKYWTHRSIIQYYTITLNRVLTQRQISYAMHDSKSYCTRKMAASQSRTVHSKTNRVCPIHTRNIGPIGPLTNTIPSPWINSNISCVDRTDPVGLGMYHTWLGCSHFSGTVALWIMHGISDLPMGKDSIQGDGIVLDDGLMGPIFLVWIGQILWVLECTVRDWDAAVFLVQ